MRALNKTELNKHLLPSADKCEIFFNVHIRLETTSNIVREAAMM